MEKVKNIVYQKVDEPLPDCSHLPIMLNDVTMCERYQKVRIKMKTEGLQTLVIYADLEHGNNFEYLTGFLPRFEESLLILHSDGKNFMVLGNENLNKVKHARILAKAIHAPQFSLPNQPMDNKYSLSDILKSSEIRENQKIGIVGWKLFTDKYSDSSKTFDVPDFIMNAIRQIVNNDDCIVNATSLFIGKDGVRCTNNANEIAHYEYGASLAGDRILEAMNHVKLGITELELGTLLNADGQKNSVVTIAASGPRFVNANLYPSGNNVKLQDAISLTVGYKGGLSSRSGYAVYDKDELPLDQQDYLEVVVKPYYNAITNWLTHIRIGMKGKELYNLIEKVLPKAIYHWSLCPGHLCADEEWLASPIYDGSEEIIRSGMIFQIDIIPSVSGYTGTSAESSVVLADACLQNILKSEEPQLWERMIKRRIYIEKELGIVLHQDVLPLASSVAYLRPFLLNYEKAMAINFK